MPMPVRILLLALALFPAGCRTRWTVESRDTPVHVWLMSPELAQTGTPIRAEVRVGPHVAIDGPVRFPRQTPNVILPALYMPASTQRVTAVIDGGRLSAEAMVSVGGPTWILVRVTSTGVTIQRTGAEPTCPPPGTFLGR
jgi:hypothetical protein